MASHIGFDAYELEILLNSHAADLFAALHNTDLLRAQKAATKLREIGTEVVRRCLIDPLCQAEK